MSTETTLDTAELLERVALILRTHVVAERELIEARAEIARLKETLVRVVEAPVERSYLARVVELARSEPELPTESVIFQADYRRRLAAASDPPKDDR